MENIENLLKAIIEKLDILIELQNKPKGLSVPNRLFGVADCVSKEEIPSHIPWNTGYVPSCDNDILKNQIMD